MIAFVSFSAGCAAPAVEAVVDPVPPPPAPLSDGRWRCEPPLVPTALNACGDPRPWRPLPPALSVATDGVTFVTAGPDDVRLWAAPGGADAGPIELVRIEPAAFATLADTPLMRTAVTDTARVRVPSGAPEPFADAVQRGLERLAGAPWSTLGWSCDVEGDVAIVATNWTDPRSAVFVRDERGWRADAVLPTHDWSMRDGVHVAAGQVLVPHPDRIEVFVRSPHGWDRGAPIVAERGVSGGAIAWTGGQLLVLRERTISLFEPSSAGWRSAGTVRLSEPAASIVADGDAAVAVSARPCRVVQLRRAADGWREVGRSTVPDCADNLFGGPAQVALGGDRLVVGSLANGVLVGPIAGPLQDLSFYRSAPGGAAYSHPSARSVAIGAGIVVSASTTGSWFRPLP